MSDLFSAATAIVEGGKLGEPIRTPHNWLVTDRQHTRNGAFPHLSTGNDNHLSINYNDTGVSFKDQNRESNKKRQKNTRINLTNFSKFYRPNYLGHPVNIFYLLSVSAVNPTKISFGGVLKAPQASKI